jgi:hypothetical protein
MHQCFKRSVSFGNDRRRERAIGEFMGCQRFPTRCNTSRTVAQLSKTYDKMKIHNPTERLQNGCAYGQSCDNQLGTHAIPQLTTEATGA